MTYQKSQKIPKIYECKNCNYLSCNKKDYNKHIETIKHKKMINTYQYLPFGYYNPKNPHFICICDKYYKHKQSLYNQNKNAPNIIIFIKIYFIFYFLFNN